MKLHYAVISTATIAERFIRAVQEDAQDEVLAIASRDIKKAKAMADRLQIEKAYGSYKECYEDPDIDIVYICCNNGNHTKECLQALQHGKHVICEKPFALSRADAQMVFDTAKKRNLFVMEAQKSFFLPVTAAVKEMIKKQTLGMLHQIEISASYPNPTQAWMHDPKQGGALYGSGTYLIEYPLFLTEPSIIRYQGMGTLEANGTIACASVNMCLDDILLNARITIKGNTQKHAVFYFEKGYVSVPVYWKAREAFVYDTEDKLIDHIQYPAAYEMIYEVRHIHECIEAGLLESPYMGASMTITCCAIVEDLDAQIRQEQ